MEFRTDDPPGAIPALVAYTEAPLSCMDQRASTDPCSMAIGTWPRHLYLVQPWRVLLLLHHPVLSLLVELCGSRSSIRILQSDFSVLMGGTRRY